MGRKAMNFLLHGWASEVSLSPKFQSVLKLNQIFNRENQDTRGILKKGDTDKLFRGAL